MEQEYLQEIVDRLQENTLMELLGDRAQVYFTHYPRYPEGYEHIAVVVRVGDIKVSRTFTFDEVRLTQEPANLVAIEIATLLARYIIVEGL